MCAAQSEIQFVVRHLFISQKLKKLKEETIQPILSCPLALTVVSTDPFQFQFRTDKLDLRCNILYSFRQQKIGILQLTAKRSNNCCNKIAMKCTVVSGDKIAMTSTRLRLLKGVKYFLKSPSYFYALTIANILFQILGPF